MSKPENAARAAGTPVRLLRLETALESFGGAEGFEDALPSFLGQVKENFAAAAVSARLLEEAEEGLLYAACPTSGAPVSGKKPVEEALAAWFADPGRPPPPSGDSAGGPLLWASVPENGKICGVIELSRLPGEAPFSEEEGEILSLLGRCIGRERGRAFEKRRLEERVAELEKGNRETDEILFKVTHELQTPLTSIKGFASTIIGDPDIAPEELREFLGIINQETDRLSSLVNALLDICRLEQGRIRLDKRLTDLNNIVLYCSESLVRRVAEKGLALTTELCDEAPEADVDPARFQQIVLNLVSNAMNFTPEGGRITLRTACSGGWFALEVVDTGCGVPEEDREKIFEKFHRSPCRQGPKGLGLGLSIVRELARIHGGRVEVESVQGKGSLFRVLIPVQAD